MALQESVLWILHYTHTHTNSDSRFTALLDLALALIESRSFARAVFTHSDGIVMMVRIDSAGKELSNGYHIEILDLDLDANAKPNLDLDLALC